MKKVFILFMVLLMISDIAGQTRIKKDECSALKTLLFPSLNEMEKVSGYLKVGNVIRCFIKIIMF
ncbi:hypothetical protein SAMN05444349_102102 [Bacteroides faecichinchillae]|uniref:Uncharacterized protein n=1 Tax=Bacteroides faecichinchillae TaxID=871325 RepID=A0A1M4TF23_9BACE|nr:hypothetical protein SAMN05444349_102102 [Bacteroides faecichinchillae]